ncbi:alpha 1,2 mannosyltransferase [Coemansia sp. RSA 1646]|nr:alpha 1,2 mannosyltransferase [Coemansia sp. RSA 1646]KAJ2093378.1 alpha 1,2 mannosyltransferase [Coemansia sp. RSA 986]
MRRTLYVALLATRVLFALSPSYIHPDEFFQAPEVAASDILGVDALRTWEFTSEEPIRSIVPIYMYSGMPFLLLRFVCHVLQTLLGMDIQPSTFAVFWSQRLYMACLSVVMDLCVCRAIRRLNPTVRLLPTALLMASSHCLLVFHTRAFGNAFASIVLALCFDLLSRIESLLGNLEQIKRRKKGSARLTKAQAVRKVQQSLCMLAAAGVLGAFTHITFAPFFAPLALVAFMMVASYTWRRFLSITQACAIILTACVCATAAGLCLVVADSVYYGTLHSNDPHALLGVSGTLTCTVLNNLRYNGSATNLATHGIHARYLHVVASMPVLFGPLYVLALLKLWTWIRRGRIANKNGGSYMSLATGSSVIAGISVLSLVRHQEPRFLLPALPGVVLSTWRWHRLLPAYFWRLWVAYNLVLAAIYGGVHQAGVVSVIKYLADTSVAQRIGCSTMDDGSMVCAHMHSESSSNVYGGSVDTTVFPSLRTNVLLYATYMAPRHLLVQKKQSQQDTSSAGDIPTTVNDRHLQAHVEMTDLVSMDDHEVQALLSAAIPVNCSAFGIANKDMLVFAPSRAVDELGEPLYVRTLFVAPASTDLEPLLPPQEDPSWNAMLVPLYSYAPHVNFDHIKMVAQNPLKYARLNVYIICARS